MIWAAFIIKMHGSVLTVWMLTGKWLSSPEHFRCSQFSAMLEWTSHPVLMSAVLCCSIVELIPDLELLHSALFPRHRDWPFCSPAENHHRPLSCRCWLWVLLRSLPGAFGWAAFVEPGWVGAHSRTGTSHLLPGSTFRSFRLWAGRLAGRRPAFSRLATQRLERLSVRPPRVTSAVRVWTQTLNRCLEVFVGASNVRKPSVGQMQVRLGY